MRNIPPHNAGHPKLSLQALEANLIYAQAELDKAAQEYRRASRQQTEAQNRLRDAQKALDTRMEELRKQHATEEWQPRRRETAA